MIKEEYTMITDSPELKLNPSVVIAGFCYAFAKPIYDELERQVAQLAYDEGGGASTIVVLGDQALIGLLRHSAQQTQIFPDSFTLPEGGGNLNVKVGHLEEYVELIGNFLDLFDVG